MNFKDYEILNTPQSKGIHYALIYGKWERVKVTSLKNENGGSGGMEWGDTRHVSLGMSNFYIKSSKKVNISLIETYKLTKDYWTGSRILDKIYKGELL